MTEADWLACTDPEKMLEALRGQASERKLRLFACACAREAWGLLTNPGSGATVEAAERFADGQAAADELARAYAAAHAITRLDAPPEHARAAAASHAAAHPDAFTAARAAALIGAAGGAGPALLRDLCGERPFGGPPAVAAEPCRAAGAVTLARRVYDGHDFAGLRALAGALESAGYGGTDLLAHLRGPGPHARGCWALDRVLGLS
jgi:hypothetical protein